MGQSLTGFRRRRKTQTTTLRRLRKAAAGYLVRSGITSPLEIAVSRMCLPLRWRSARRVVVSLSIRVHPRPNIFQPPDQDHSLNVILGDTESNLPPFALPS